MSSEIKILLDGDSFSKIDTVQNICKEKQMQLDVYHDYNHELDLEYGIEHIVEPGRDSADIAIINNVDKGDIVITNDYGLASLAIAKKCFVINRFGEYITKKMIHEKQATKFIYEREKIKNKKKRGKAKSLKHITIISNNEIPKPHYDFATSLTNLIDKAKKAKEER